MKKILATVLALLMAVGVFAVGASAAPLLPFAAQEFESPFVTFAEKNPRAALNEMTFRVQLELMEANLDTMLTTHAILLFWNRPGAFANGQAGVDAFQAAVLEAETPMRPQLHAARSAWWQFVNDSSDATLAAGLADGTAERLFRAYREAMLVSQRASAAVAEAHVLPQALAFAREYSRALLIYFAAQLPDNMEALENALIDLQLELLNVNSVSAAEAALLAMFAANDWAALYAYYAAFNPDFASLIVEFGGAVPPWLLATPINGGGNYTFFGRPSTWYNWLLFFLAFGWIWMWF